MILATTLCTFRTGTSKEKINWIKELGFLAAGADPMPDLVDDDWSGFKNLAVHAPFIDLNLLSGQKEVRELSRKLCKESVEWAANLGVKTVTFHPGDRTYQLTEEESDQIMREVMVEFDQYTAKHNLWACWETGTGYFVPLNKFEMIRELGLKNTGICFDSGHLERVWRQFSKNDEIDTFPKFIHRFGDLIKCTHLHDWIDQPTDDDGWLGQDHHMIGNGCIDWPELLKALVDVGYDGDLLLEYNRHSFNTMDELKSNIRKFADMLRGLGAKVEHDWDKLNA